MKLTYDSSSPVESRLERLISRSYRRRLRRRNVEGTSPKGPSPQGSPKKAA